MVVNRVGFWDEVYLVSTGQDGKIIGRFCIFSDVPGTRPQGHVLESHFPGALSLWSVHIDEEHRGKGYGHILMRDVISELGDRSCWLTVDSDKHIAHKLYKRYGFVDFIIRERYKVMYREV